MRRQQGSGSVFQRDSDRRWVARVVVDGRRITRYADTQDGALDCLTELHREYPPILTDPIPRSVALRAARAKGTHTRAQWIKKLRDAPRTSTGLIRCFYCWTPTHITRIEKDHFTPITRGGSDSIDNIVPACRTCNRQKCDLTGLEWFNILALDCATQTEHP